jgi:hypothetical protein
MMNTSTELPRVFIGTVQSVDAAGGPCVQWSDGEPTPARVVWMSASVDWTHCVGLRVILGFVDGDEEHPVVLGLLDAPRVASAREPEVLRIASGRELVIECGEARIALRADGRVEVRGTHLVSRSSGPNKVKGATVHIN